MLMLMSVIRRRSTGLTDKEMVMLKVDEVMWQFKKLSARSFWEISSNKFVKKYFRKFCQPICRLSLLKESCVFMSTDTICDQPLTIAFCPSIPAVVVVYIISGSGAGQIEPSVDCLLSHTTFTTWMVRVQWIQNSNSSKIIQIILFVTKNRCGTTKNTITGRHQDRWKMKTIFFHFAALQCSYFVILLVWRENFFV